MYCAATMCVSSFFLGHLCFVLAQDLHGECHVPKRRYCKRRYGIALNTSSEGFMEATGILPLDSTNALVLRLRTLGAPKVSGFQFESINYRLENPACK